MLASFIGLIFVDYIVLNDVNVINIDWSIISLYKNLSSNVVNIQKSRYKLATAVLLLGNFSWFEPVLCAIVFLDLEWPIWPSDLMNKYKSLPLEFAKNKLECYSLFSGRNFHHNLNKIASVIFRSRLKFLFKSLSVYLAGSAKTDGKELSHSQRIFAFVYEEQNSSEITFDRLKPLYEDLRRQQEQIVNVRVISGPAITR